MSSFRSDLVRTSYEALSDRMEVGTPLLETKRLRARTKCCVEREVVASQWIALDAMQVKRSTQTFFAKLSSAR